MLTPTPPVSNVFLNDNRYYVIIQKEVMNKAIKGDLGEGLKKHLLQVLSVKTDPKPWPAERSLPEYLRDAYSFQAARILGAACLFMTDRGVHRQTPAAIRKHVLEVSRKWKGEVVYVAAGVDSARRKQLIDQGVAFVVPGNQVYLPTLGVDLREHFRNTKGISNRLSPATQAMLLRALHGTPGPFSPTEMAAATGYTSMTMSRAFDELQASGLGRHFTAGKRRLMELGAPARELWERVLPMLKSPVADRTVVSVPPGGLGAPAAGLSALAGYTNLAEPRRSLAAIARSAWSSIRSRFTAERPELEEQGGTEVELWTYAPAAVSPGPVVDRLSLFLSLRGTSDERVEAALEDLLEGMKW